MSFTNLILSFAYGILYSIDNAPQHTHKDSFGFHKHRRSCFERWFQIESPSDSGHLKCLPRIFINRCLKRYSLIMYRGILDGSMCRDEVKCWKSHGVQPLQRTAITRRSERQQDYVAGPTVMHLLADLQSRLTHCMPAHLVNV